MTVSDDFPDFDDDFWKTVDSPETKSALVFMIMNKLRGVMPEAMSNEQLRSTLSELKAYQSMLDLKPVIEAQKAQTEEREEYQDDADQFQN